MASAAGSLSRRSVSPTRRSAASSPPTTASRTQHESPPSSRSLTTSSCARLSARTSGYPRAVLYMPCHAMPCHAMPCHAMPCHAMHTWHACGHVQVRQVPLRPRRLRACMHAHTHAYVHAHVHACTHACIRARPRACMHTRTHTCMHASQVREALLEPATGGDRAARQPPCGCWPPAAAKALQALYLAIPAQRYLPSDTYLATST